MLDSVRCYDFATALIHTYECSPQKQAQCVCIFFFLNSKHFQYCIITLRRGDAGFKSSVKKGQLCKFH